MKPQQPPIIREMVLIPTEACSMQMEHNKLLADEKVAL